MDKHVPLQLLAERKDFPAQEKELTALAAGSRAASLWGR